MSDNRVLTEDDEWEAAEQRIEELTISQNTKRPSVVLPEYLAPDNKFDSDYNFFSDSQASGVSKVANDTSVKSRGTFSNVQPSISAPSLDSTGFQLQYSSGGGNSGYSQDTPVEEALLEALRNSKERINALRIEKDVFDFVSSGKAFYEIPAQNNSFRRLLIYKVAQRFYLDHKATDYVSETGERGVLVTIFRTNSTCFPRPLLIDITQTMDQAERGSVVAPAINPKVKLMQRSRLNELNDKPVALKTAPTAEDKERKYLAARARIFGDADDSDVALSAFMAGEKESRVEVGSSAPTPPPDDTTTETKPLEEASSESRSSNGGGNSGGKGKRSVHRNKDLEKADPDFARRQAAPLYNPAYPPYPVMQQQYVAPYGHQYPVQPLDMADPYAGNPYYANPYQQRPSPQGAFDAYPQSGTQQPPGRSYNNADFPPLP